MSVFAFVTSVGNKLIKVSPNVEGVPVFKLKYVKGTMFFSLKSHLRCLIVLLYSVIRLF